MRYRPSCLLKWVEGKGVLKGAQQRQDKTKQPTHQLNNMLTLRLEHSQLQLIQKSEPNLTAASVQNPESII